jgi:hypothetical protein
MAIITLGGLFFVLPYRLDPTDAASVQHGKRAVVEPHALWLGHTFHQGWAQKPLGLGS